LLLLLQLHLLQLFQQLFRSFGLVGLLLLVLRSRRLLHWRRLNGSVLRFLVRRSVLRHIFLAFLLLSLRLRGLHWLLWRLTCNGARSPARPRCKNHALHCSGAVRPSEDNVVETRSAEDPSQHFAFRSGAKVHHNAF